MKLLKIFLIVLLTTFCIETFGQIILKYDAILNDPTDQPDEMIIDVEHVKVHFHTFRPSENFIKGNTIITFKTLRKDIDSIFFQCPKVTIHKVSMQNKDIKFKMNDNGVWVFPEKTLDWHKNYIMFVEHEANPFIYPNFAGWKSNIKTKPKQIWGFHLLAAMPWIGHKHDLTTSETLVTFDKNYKVLSNGDRVSVKDNEDGTLTWHYLLNKPHGFYLQSIVIGEYEYKTFKTKRGIPLEYWYYPSQKDKFDWTYKYSIEMFEYLEEEFGLLYPWSVYRQAPVVDCPFGGMETTTATVFNDMFMTDARAYLDRNYVNVNVHELIHHWFGNYVSYANSENVWISESFATYYAKKFEQYIFGEEYYQNIRLQEYLITMNAAEKDDFPVGHSQGVIARWYPKGSLVLDMLRYVMGDDEFKHFIKHFLNKHSYAIVEGNDYLIAIRESTGQTLDWFFKQWIYKGGEPQYQVSYKEVKNMHYQKVTQILVEQIHATNHIIGLFRMPIVFEVHYKDGTKDSVKQWIEKQLEIVEIPNQHNKEIDYVLFDPNRNILKKTSFNRTFDELCSQLIKAYNIIDRYDALIELRNISVETKRQYLITAFHNETFFLLKEEILSQLKNDNHQETNDLIVKALNNKDSKVRQAVAKHIKVIPIALKEEYMKLLSDSSYRTIEYALGNLFENFENERSQILEITENEMGWWGLNIRMKWLELAYEHKGDTEYLKKIIAYSDIDDYEIHTVANAIQSLVRLHYCDERVVINLCKAYLYWSDRVKISDQNALNTFYKHNKYRRIINKALTQMPENDATQISSIL